MKIAIFYTCSPYIRGGTEILVDDLENQLVKAGNLVDVFSIPFPSDIMDVVSLSFVCRGLRFDDYDAVIVHKFPAFYIKHKNKILWMFHQFRQVYELFGLEYGLANDEKGLLLKKLITKMDNNFLIESKKIFVNAEEVKKRLKKYNNIDSEVLTPPQKDISKYYCDKYENYIFMPSRVNSFKRQLLAVEAMGYVNKDVKLIICGECKDKDYDEKIRKTIKEKKLESKVVYRNEWISDDEKIELMANSLYSIYIPYKEDSCGFVTFEAFYSHKGVITCLDSGGTLEFVKNGQTGFVCDSTAIELGKLIDRICSLDIAKDVGERAYKYIKQCNITWDETIKRLLQ